MFGVLIGTIASPPAYAVIFGGNPELTIDAIRSPADLVEGSVDLDKVRMHACGGGATDVSVGVTIDPVEGYTVGVPAGNWCGVTVFWDSVMTLDGSGLLGDYTLEYAEAATYVAVTGNVQTKELTPYDVTSGVIFGGNPELRLSFE